MFTNIRPINELLTTPVWQMIGAEYVALQKFANSKVAEKDVEWVDKEGRNEALCVKSDSTALTRIKWGEKNGISVSKNGKRFWSKTDLIELRNAFALANDL